ncbi:helix-turn-helix domain-containing protein [Zavarzinia compransoris]|uniref:Transcriptional regulator n=1 Tax=Zavarzinia compransoris TaxID=1264899 RepID=A0A317E659_9PROT|nr:helix-turn-helix transcriptional regulator [Zavarzinia compransoris]PWR21686.1 transcriptional regulator [Zavarzinia compransoris]TDP45530.1 helix-turn-helix protein [Zavarzinia compransoris]
MKILKDVIAGLPEAERKAVEARTATLVAEEMTLRDLRRALAVTQEQMAETMKVRQANISQIERRADLLISTLRQAVAAMGGSLDLVATFPDRPPVKIAGLGDIG